MLDFAKLRSIPKHTPEMEALAVNQTKTIIVELLCSTFPTAIVLSRKGDTDNTTGIIEATILGPAATLRLEIKITNISYSDDCTLKFRIALEDTQIKATERVFLTIDNSTTYTPHTTNLFLHSIIALGQTVLKTENFQTIWAFQNTLQRSLKIFREIQDRALTKVNVPFEEKDSYKAQYGKDGTIRPNSLFWEPATKSWFFLGEAPPELLP